MYDALIIFNFIRDERFGLSLQLLVSLLAVFEKALKFYNFAHNQVFKGVIIVCLANTL